MLDDARIRLFKQSGAYFVPTLSTVNGYIEQLAADPNVYQPAVLANVKWRIELTGKSQRLKLGFFHKCDPLIAKIGRFDLIWCSAELAIFLFQKDAFSKEFTSGLTNCLVRSRRSNIGTHRIRRGYQYALSCAK